ncbi:hypothetical protein D3C75_1083290 [compost metagenome]
MMKLLCLRCVPKHLQSLLHHRLRVFLSVVDNIDDHVRFSKRHLRSRQTSGPQPLIKFAVSEILVQQAKFPEMIGDILGGVG